MKIKLSFLFIVLTILITSCISMEQSDSKGRIGLTNLEIQSQKASSAVQQPPVSTEENRTAPDLNDFQITACDSAHKYNTCDRLPDLGLVTNEKCCKALKECCN